ncbi:hypothetical protein [uncultured Desulfuromonas sp.]|uniref:hypothetical protein n=1 Tax=uncultured Desulfuromonas sp. TaxID=181013 RepID=UPI002AAC3231|nr:hypothetical protein [uncultured Desulfuromonas sp.]
MVRNPKRIALANFIRSRRWYPRDAGFRARTSGHFCVDKSTAKSTPVIAPLRVPSLRSLTSRCRQNSLTLKQVADDHRADRFLRSALLNGRAWLLNNKPRQGWTLPTRLIGATEEIKCSFNWLSTFYATDDELHDSPT